MIRDDVVERVREQADIVQIVGEFVKLKRVGNSYRGPCPFHQGTHDNFSVLPRGSYLCFVCGEKGDVFDFVRKRLGLDFAEAVKWVGERSGVEVTEVSRQREGPDPREPLWEINAAAAELFQRQLWDEESGARAREYLTSRGIDRPAAERFGLGWAPRDAGVMRDWLKGLGFDDDRQRAGGLLVQREGGDEPRPRFRARLMFPIYDLRDHVVGFGGRVIGEGEPKYLNSAESEIFAKRQLLYGLNWAKHAVRKADRLIVVEGYFDLIRLVLAGIEEVVAPLGTALTEAQASLIRKYTKNVFLLYDSDAAGQKATFRAGDELLRNGLGVHVITLPEGEDPDTFVARHGAAGLERAAEQAIDVFDRKVQILERSGWFADVRRKREALDKLLPTIRATTDPLLRDLYIARTSDAAGVSRELLQRELAASPPPAVLAPKRSSRGFPPELETDEERVPAPAVAVRRRERRTSRQSVGVRAERELVRVLLHERRYVEPVAEKIGEDAFTDPALRSIFSELIAQGAEAPIGEIAGTFDEETIEVLQELLAERGGLERAGEIVEGSLNAMVARDIDVRLGDIDRLLPVASSEEKDDLIREKTRLTGELQALGRGRYKSFRASPH